MNAEALKAKYEVSPAIVDNGYGAWVYSKAQELDIKDPRMLSLVRDLSVVMEQALKDNRWGAVSSNNLYWNATDKPVRAVMVPHSKLRENITLINPKITGYGIWETLSVEGCGSFPGKLYTVKRKTFVEASAYLLTETCFVPVHFEYGARDLKKQDKQKSQSSLEKKILKASLVQHEIEHLDGIVIAQKGIYYGGDDGKKKTKLYKSSFIKCKNVHLQH